MHRGLFHLPIFLKNMKETEDPFKPRTKKHFALFRNIYIGAASAPFLAALQFLNEGSPFSNRLLVLLFLLSTSGFLVEASLYELHIRLPGEQLVDNESLEDRRNPGFQWMPILLGLVALGYWMFKPWATNIYPYGNDSSWILLVLVLATVLVLSVYWCRMKLYKKELEEAHKEKAGN